MAEFAIKRRIRAVWQKLKRFDARPEQIAAGFSIGIVASFIPLNPSPVVVATIVAWLLNRSVLPAIAGAVMAILYSPLLPLIWLAEYRLGKMLLPVQRPLTLDHESVWDLLQQGWDVYAAMFVGSIIIATPVTVITYWVVKRLAQRWARKKLASRRQG